MASESGCHNVKLIVCVLLSAAGTVCVITALVTNEWSLHEKSGIQEKRGLWNSCQSTIDKSFLRSTKTTECNLRFKIMNEEEKDLWESATTKPNLPFRIWEAVALGLLGTSAILGVCCILCSSCMIKVPFSFSVTSLFASAFAAATLALYYYELQSKQVTTISTNARGSFGLEESEHLDWGFYTAVAGFSGQFIGGLLAAFCRTASRYRRANDRYYFDSFRTQNSRHGPYVAPALLNTSTTV